MREHDHNFETTGPRPQEDVARLDMLTSPQTATPFCHPQVAYESDAILAQYLSLHYGPMDRVVPDLVRETGIIADALDFPRKLADCLTAWSDRCGLLGAGAEAPSSSGRDAASGPRALDLGCAVGRSSFELSRRFAAVVGVDISRT